MPEQHPAAGAPVAPALRPRRAYHPPQSEAYGRLLDCTLGVSPGIGESGPGGSVYKANAFTLTEEAWPSADPLASRP